jgi:hypothetical protein
MQTRMELKMTTTSTKAMMGTTIVTADTLEDGASVEAGGGGSDGYRSDGVMDEVKSGSTGCGDVIVLGRIILILVLCFVCE